ncbi:hypothetical protein C0Q70_14866 [Pomacea canaliculata]|uniref:acylglycerol lipase n=1 Tax=Pomacea canaliculata TaxID=400727 RepID=A0A2T7NT98_POMCA|nr:hypothetical protein C0Q70_14866 [Pomacea canaliculata]
MMPFSISKKQTPMVDTKYGKYPRGSTLAHQQKLHDSFIMNFTELATFPDLPLRNVMSGDIPDLSEEKIEDLLTSLKVTQQESVVLERDTRLQSNCPLWHKLRQHRITASVVADVAKRKKDFQALSKRLKSSKTRMTQAMKDGIKNEPLAAEAYSNSCSSIEGMLTAAGSSSAVAGSASAVVGSASAVAGSESAVAGSESTLYRSSCGMQVKFIGNADTVFCYGEKGKESKDKSSILFIHGYTGSKDHWVQAFKMLGNNHHLVAIDLPGHGASSTPPAEQELTIEYALESIKLFAEMVGLTDRPFHIVGGSLGGCLAGMFAATYPHLVERVTLVCPAMKTPEPSEFMKQVERAVEIGAENVQIHHCSLLPQTTQELQLMVESCVYADLKLSSQILKGVVQLRTPKNEFYLRELSSPNEYIYNKKKRLQTPTVRVVDVESTSRSSQRRGATPTLIPMTKEPATIEAAIGRANCVTSGFKDFRKPYCYNMKISLQRDMEGTNTTILPHPWLSERDISVKGKNLAAPGVDVTGLTMV